MQFFINIFLLTFTLIITGCSSKKLTIKSLHPSKIEKEKIHTITIQRFYRDDVEQTTSIINKIANKTVDNKKIFTIKNTNSEVDAILAGDVLNSSINVYEYFRTQTDYSRCRFYRYDDKNKTKECIEYRIINIPCEKREYNVKTNVILTKPITNDIIFSKTYDKSNKLIQKAQAVLYKILLSLYPLSWQRAPKNHLNESETYKISADYIYASAFSACRDTWINESIKKYIWEKVLS